MIKEQFCRKCGMTKKECDKVYKQIVERCCISCTHKRKRMLSRN